MLQRRLYILHRKQEQLYVNLQIVELVDSKMENIVFSDIAHYSRSIVTGLIIVIGILANTTSLSFFVRYQRRSLGDKLLIILNITDLLICCFCLANLIFFIDYVKSMEWLLKIKRVTKRQAPSQDQDTFVMYWHIALVPPCIHLALFSCFTTLVLTLTRTIALVKPLCPLHENYSFGNSDYSGNHNQFVIAVLLCQVSEKQSRRQAPHPLEQHRPSYLLSFFSKRHYLQRLHR
ncbi:hypothetical protein ACHWQZ_G004248 [Mnemiopsis leidyi]